MREKQSIRRQRLFAMGSVLAGVIFTALSAGFPSAAHAYAAGLAPVARLSPPHQLFAATSQQTGGSQFFPQTGKTVQDRFLDYWNAHGGLIQQGYPISDEMQEQNSTDGRTYTVQYFERAEFEYQPENPAPYDVLLSLLGAQQFASKYPSGAPGQEFRHFERVGAIPGGRAAAWAECSWTIGRATVA